MTIVFPDILRSNLLSSYGYKKKETFIRTEMDTGYVRQRKRFTSTPVTFTLKFLFDEGELGYFESWFENVLNGGIEYFNMDLKVGAGVVTHSVRFIESPTIKANNQYFDVDIKCEGMTLVLQDDLAEDQLAFIEDSKNDLGSESAFQKAQRRMDLLNELVNIDWILISV